MQYKGLETREACEVKENGEEKFLSSDRDGGFISDQAFEEIEATAETDKTNTGIAEQIEYFKNCRQVLRKEQLEELKAQRRALTEKGSGEGDNDEQKVLRLCRR